MLDDTIFFFDNMKYLIVRSRGQMHNGTENIVEKYVPHQPASGADY